MVLSMEYGDQDFSWCTSIHNLCANDGVCGGVEPKLLQDDIYHLLCLEAGVVIVFVNVP